MSAEPPPSGPERPQSPAERLKGRLAAFERHIGHKYTEVVELRLALSKETDRGCALFAAAYLDGELEGLLRAKMVADERVASAILSPDRPLGSFSARIDVAYLLGLIPRLARLDLHLIRKIRNDFAHTARRLSFAEPVIAARCREFRYVILERDSDPRHLFTNAALGVAAMVQGGHLEADQAQAPDDVAANASE
jgi:hypothetical protein